MVLPSSSKRLGALVILAWFCLCCGSVEPSVFDRFLRFIDDFNRPYKNGTQEFEHRFINFKLNIERIEKLNTPYGDGTSPVFGINKFSDLSQEEFAAQYLDDLRPVRRTGDTVLKFQSEMLPDRKKLASYLPQKINWKEAGVVTPVKNQGSCGACWAFSVVEMVESNFAITHNTTPPVLAVQQLIDCSSKNFGCKGGDICVALTYLKTAGIGYDEDYPLTDEDGTCHVLPSGDRMVRIANYSCKRYVGHEEQILEHIANVGPLSAAVDASTWNNYVGGIIKFHCGSTINHAVDIVGYDLTGPVPYYIVRNSWGTDFGMDGYMYIRIGNNVCGIAQDVADVHVS